MLRETLRGLGAKVGESESRKKVARMPSSTSSQESRVSTGGRLSLLARRPRFGSKNGSNKFAGKLRPLFVSKGVVKDCEGALAAISHKESQLPAQEKTLWEADRSVLAPLEGAVAIENDDDDLQILAVTLGRPLLRKVVLPLKDCIDVGVGDADVSKGAAVATPVSPPPVEELERDIDELTHEPKVDPTAALGFLPTVEADMEAERVHAQVQEEIIASQIRFLEKQMIYHIDIAIRLKQQFDAGLASIAKLACPCARDRAVRDCPFYNESIKRLELENATTAWLFFEKFLEDRRAEWRHLRDGLQHFDADGEQTGSWNTTWGSDLASAMLKEIVDGKMQNVEV